MSAAADPDATVFGFPSGYRALFTVLLVASCGFLAFFIFGLEYVSGWPTRLASIGGGALFALLAVLSAIYLSKARNRISVDENGIEYLPYRGAAIFIGWNDASEIEAHDVVKRLTIIDISGLKRIQLEYQLENFDALREIVLEKTSALRNLKPAPSEFYRGYQNRGFLFAAFLIFASTGCVGFHATQSKAALAFFSFAAFALFGLAREPSKVSIYPDLLRIAYLGWHRAIPFSQVTNIELISVRGRDISAAVPIETLAGKPLSLMGFRGGSIALYDGLRRSWSPPAGLANESSVATASLETQATSRSLSATSIRSAVFYADKRTWLILVSPALTARLFALIGFVHRPLREIAIISLFSYLAIFLVCQLYLFNKLPLRITFSDHSVNVECLLSRRLVPYRTIANVELRNALNEGGKPFETVAVRLKDGRTLSLGNWKSRDGSLYEVLNAAHKNDA